MEIMEEYEFQVGDVVELNSGGPRMTVAAVDVGVRNVGVRNVGVQTVWIGSDGSINSGNFLAVMLRIPKVKLSRPSTLVGPVDGI